MLRQIGESIVRWRWAVLAVWIGAAVIMVFTVPVPDPRLNELPGFLPTTAPSEQASAALGRLFPHSAGLSQAVVAIERPKAALTEEDFGALDQVGKQIQQIRVPGEDDDAANALQVLSPTDIPFLRDSLVSLYQAGKGQGAIILVQVPANFITLKASDLVDRIQAIVDGTRFPPGLNVAVTGSASFGHDYSQAATASSHRTLWVTITAVIIILLLVYRAPLASAVPLLGISLAAVVATEVLEALSPLGLRVGPGEKIFVYVLLYGAGVDYALFLLGRYREFLQAGAVPHKAMAAAWHTTSPAIVASSATVISGLLMLSLAQYRVFRQVGPSVALALGVALLAALTLVPAVVAVLGNSLFWPARSAQPTFRRFWPAVAKWVTTRPLAPLLLVMLALGVPAMRGTHLTWVYDTLADLKPTYPSVRGADIIKRHWPIGELAPVTVVVEAPRQMNLDQLTSLASALTKQLRTVDGVSEVRSLSSPVGKDNAATQGSFVAKLAAVSFYSTVPPRATRLSVVLAYPAFSNEAMATLLNIRQSVGRVLADSPLKGSQVYIAGATAEMADIRTLTQGDFSRVAVASLVVIAAIVLVLLRDALLSLFLVFSTVLSYMATLGITYWVFASLLGYEGIDWKVEVFLFVVMVAVGQDYNIFLTSRLAQEAVSHPPAIAAGTAIVTTGGIISSCGLIMAATLGSLMAGDLQLLVELGFAFACGMLIDTFVVRPLLVPAFCVLTRRTGRSVLVHSLEASLPLTKQPHPAEELTPLLNKPPDERAS